LFECPCILENFTSSDFDFLYYIITVFVHFHFGIQGESQVFEVVNFADHFVVRVGESSLSARDLDKTRYDTDTSSVLATDRDLRQAF